MRHSSLWAVALAVVASSLFVQAEDWPRWRGPRLDSISQEKLPEKWPAEGPKKVWSAKVGLGYSSPVAVEGKIYMFSLLEGKETLTAYNADTGKEDWTVSTDTGWTKGNMFPGTRATPVIEGDKIYTFGGAGDLVCRQKADGKLLWQTNVLKETGARNITWGTASNPLIVGEKIYVQGGAGGPIAVAVEKATGKIVMKAEEKANASYATPVLIDVGGKPQLLVFAGTQLVSMEPESGKTLWKEPWPTQYEINATPPVFKDSTLFVTSAYNQGSMVLKVTADGAKKEKEIKDVDSRFQATVLEGDHLYVNSEGTIKCLKWPEMDTVWSGAPDTRIGMGGSFVRAGDKLVAMSENGKLLLLKATPAGIEKICETSPFERVEKKECWATPLLYNGKLYAKGISELVCLDLAAK